MWLIRMKKCATFEETMFGESVLSVEIYCDFVSFLLTSITRIVAKYLKDNSPLTKHLLPVK